MELLTRFPADKQIESYVFSLSACIGKGSSGTVYVGRHSLRQQVVAIKAIDMRSLKTEYAWRMLSSEVRIMKKLHHPHVVNMLDVFQTKNNTYIITEFCNQGDLRTYLKKKLLASPQGLPVDLALVIISQIISGLSELSAQGIIHRDLKPANILVSDGIFKITDFGFAKKLDSMDDQLMESLVGTPLYMAPQILNKQQYTSKCDVWSIGLIFYEMLFGRTPWPAVNVVDLVTKITNIPLTFPHKSTIPPAVTSFILKCLKLDEIHRISMQDMCADPLFTSFVNNRNPLTKGHQPGTAITSASTPAPTSILTPVPTLTPTSKETKTPTNKLAQDHQLPPLNIDGESSSAARATNETTTTPSQKSSTAFLQQMQTVTRFSFEGQLTADPVAPMITKTTSDIPMDPTDSSTSAIGSNSRSKLHDCPAQEITAFSSSENQPQQSQQSHPHSNHLDGRSSSSPTSNPSSSATLACASAEVAAVAPESERCSSSSAQQQQQQILLRSMNSSESVESEPKPTVPTTFSSSISPSKRSNAAAMTSTDQKGHTKTETTNSQDSVESSEERSASASIVDASTADVAATKGSSSSANSIIQLSSASTTSFGRSQTTSEAASADVPPPPPLQLVSPPRPSQAQTCVIRHHQHLLTPLEPSSTPLISSSTSLVKHHHSSAVCYPPQSLPVQFVGGGTRTPLAEIPETPSSQKGYDLPPPPQHPHRSTEAKQQQSRTMFDRFGCSTSPNSRGVNNFKTIFIPQIQSQSTSAFVTKIRANSVLPPSYQTGRTTSTFIQPKFHLVQTHKQQQNGQEVLLKYQQSQKQMNIASPSFSSSKTASQLSRHPRRVISFMDIVEEQPSQAPDTSTQVGSPSFNRPITSIQTNFKSASFFIPSNSSPGVLHSILPSPSHAIIDLNNSQSRDSHPHSNSSSSKKDDAISATILKYTSQSSVSSSTFYSTLSPQHNPRGEGAHQSSFQLSIARVQNTQNFSSMSTTSSSCQSAQESQTNTPTTTLDRVQSEQKQDSLLLLLPCQQTASPVVTQSHLQRSFEEQKVQINQTLELCEKIKKVRECVEQVLSVNVRLENKLLYEKLIFLLHRHTTLTCLFFKQKIIDDRLNLMQCSDWSAFGSSSCFEQFASRFSSFHEEVHAAAQANWTHVHHSQMFKDDTKKDYYFSKLFLPPSSKTQPVEGTSDHTNFYFYIYQLLKQVIRNAVLRYETDHANLPTQHKINSAIISSLSSLVEYHQLLKLIISSKQDFTIICSTLSSEHPTKHTEINEESYKNLKQMMYIYDLASV